MNYFIKEHLEIHTHAPQIDWQIDEGVDFLLPKMKTDVTLEYGNLILIIDAKFYSSNTSQNYGKDMIIVETYIKFLLMLKIKLWSLKERMLKLTGC